MDVTDIASVAEAAELTGRSVGEKGLAGQTVDLINRTSSPEFFGQQQFTRRWNRAALTTRERYAALGHSAGTKTDDQGRSGRAGQAVGVGVYGPPDLIDPEIPTDPGIESPRLMFHECELASRADMSRR